MGNCSSAEKERPRPPPGPPPDSSHSDVPPPEEDHGVTTVVLRLPDGASMSGVAWCGYEGGKVILVAGVVPGLAGDTSGVKVGWQVLSVDGMEVDSEAALHAALSSLRETGSCELRMTPTFAESEVAAHKRSGSFWVVVGHTVYDVTDVLAAHPEKEAVFRGSDEERIIAAIAADFAKATALGRVRPARLEDYTNAASDKNKAVNDRLTELTRRRERSENRLGVFCVPQP